MKRALSNEGMKKGMKKELLGEQQADQTKIEL
jgi:hypothetical protein